MATWKARIKNSTTNFIPCQYWVIVILSFHIFDFMLQRIIVKVSLLTPIHINNVKKKTKNPGRRTWTLGIQLILAMELRHINLPSRHSTHYLLLSTRHQSLFSCSAFILYDFGKKSLCRGIDNISSRVFILLILDS